LFGVLSAFGIDMFRKLLAIFLKDLLTATSYRLAFVSQFFLPMFMVVSFFFLSRLLGDASLPGLHQYGGAYPPFALIGIVFTTYTSIFFATVVSTIRRGQTMGTLELLLTTRTSLPTYLAGSAIHALLQGSIVVFLFIGLGVLAFGVRFPDANVLAGMLVLALSMFTMIGLGIIAGSFVLIYKQGDPLSLLINSEAFLLSGVVYPVSVLPGWLQIGSGFLPHTYALEALRMALLQGASLAQVSAQIGALALFAVGALSASYLFFTYAVRRVRVEGSLA
jgi:ABC-2 type transport system permease protein